MRAGDSTQVRTLDRALRVHRFVLKCFFEFGMDHHSIHARLCCTILRVLMSPCNHFDRCQQPMSIQSISRFASDPLRPVVFDLCRPRTVSISSLPSVCMMVFKFENDRDHPARAVDSTQVRTVDRGLGVHRFVLKCFSGSAWIAVRSIHDCVRPFYEF